MKRITVLALLATLVVAGGSIATASSDAGSPAAPTVVGTDPLGDWGGGGDAAAAGHALGQDLLSATVGMPTAETVDFVLGVSFLPSAGGVPEATRYTWNFDVDKTPFELDGKFTNYSRGACDPTSGQCPPPRDPGPAPFLLRGDCTVGDGNVTSCRELAKVTARFDPAARTITIPVPATLLELQPCSRITAGANLFGGSVSATPSAFFTSSAMPLDTLDVSKPFRAPSADPAVPCTA